jgi:hypothetical protein
VRVFEIAMLRRIRGIPIGGWIKLHSEVLHNSYCSPDAVRIIMGHKISEACSMHVGMKDLHAVLAKDQVGRDHIVD